MPQTTTCAECFQLLIQIEEVHAADAEVTYRDKPTRATRIAMYAERAARGEPLFTDEWRVDLSVILRILT